MKTLKDYKKARHTYFRIDSAYEWGQGWTNNEEADRFHTEFPELFKEAGWDVDVPKDCHTCATVTKGITSLYLHPMNFSGPCEDAHIEEVKDIISKVDTVRLYGFDQYNDIYMVDDLDDEMHLYHLINDEWMDIWIMFETTTKRSNLYKRRSEIEDYLRKKVDVYTSIRYCGYCSGDTGYRYVASWIDKFINEGWIKVTDDGKLIRWANKKEQKALEKSK